MVEATELNATPQGRPTVYREKNPRTTNLHINNTWGGGWFFAIDKDSQKSSSSLIRLCIF